MKPVRAGQGLRHDLFGFGTAVSSNEERTTVDFNDHGRKTFMTDLLTADLVAEVPPKPKAAKARATKPPGGTR